MPEKIRLSLALLLITAVLSQPAWAEKPVLKIGVVLHLTGDLAMQSAAFREGMELAADEVNGAGNLQLRLIFEDGRNNAGASNAAARKLLETDHVSAAIISSYLDAMSAGPLFERARIPAVVIWDSNPEIDALGRYIFALGPWTPNSGQAPARFAFNRLKARSAAMVVSQDPFSQAAAAYFKAEFERLGGKVTDEFSMNIHDLDFRAVLARIRAVNPDVLFTPIVHNLVPFYRQAHEMQLSQPRLSCDVISDEHIIQAPEAFEGIYQSMIPAPDSPGFEQLQSKYQARCGRPITLKWYVSIGYDALRLIAEAAGRGGSEPEAIAGALYQIKNFPGVSAAISINPHGSSPQFERIHKIRERHLVPVE